MPVLAQARHGVREPMPPKTRAAATRGSLEGDVEARSRSQVGAQPVRRGLEDRAAVPRQAQPEPCSAAPASGRVAAWTTPPGCAAERGQAPAPPPASRHTRGDADHDLARRRLGQAPEVALHPDAVVAARVAEHGSAPVRR
jgi:hypothetical protein